MSKTLLVAMAVSCLACVRIGAGQEKVIFREDFESGEVGERPVGSWYFTEGTGASCLVSEEGTEVPGSPGGSKNLRFAKTQTGSGSDLTVGWGFEEYAEEVMSSGKLTATYWVYFASGELMRHIAFRGAGPYKHYMKMVVRGNWPDDIRLEFPINGPQKLLGGPAWHKLTFVMEWDPVWPLPPGGIPKSDVECRFFIDDEEHPGSPANILEDLVSPFGSVELNTAAWAPAVCYIDEITVMTALPRPEIESLSLRDGKVALSWKSVTDLGGIPALYQAFDPGGPWTLAQGNIESACSVNPGAVSVTFYRVGPQQAPSPERKVIFAEDFEGYSSSGEVETVGGWRITNGCGVPEVAWRLCNTAGEPLQTEDPDLTGMSGNYMISNSDFSQEARLDEELVSPIIDCTGYSKVGVEFRCNVKVYEDDPEDAQITELDLSIYDGDLGSWSAWTNVFRRDMSGGDWSSEAPKFFDVGALADGQSIRFRWRFREAQYDYWWAIDDVNVTGE